MWRDSWEDHYEDRTDCDMYVTTQPRAREGITSREGNSKAEETFSSIYSSNTLHSTNKNVEENKIESCESWNFDMKMWKDLVDPDHKLPGSEVYVLKVGFGWVVVKRSGYFIRVLSKWESNQR